MNTEPLLRVENLKTQFVTENGTVRAVDGISFEVHEGEIVAGEITYKGRTIFAAEETDDGDRQLSEDVLSAETVRQEIRGNEIAVIFQDPMESLNPVFTIGGQLREFIELNRDLTGDAARAEAIDMLREVGIPDAEARYDEYPHQFSGGMRQRVLIAMALACQPSLIIADEPTTALDVTVEGQILDLVDELQRKYGTSFIWVTHDMGVVAEICDRVNVMYLGEIVEQAPVDELFHETGHPYTKALLDSMPRPDRTITDLDPIRGVMPEAIDPPPGCRFHPRCPDAREVCRQIHPEPAEIDRVDGFAHRSACFKREVFDVGYDESPPLDNLARSERGQEPSEVASGGEANE